MQIKKVQPQKKAFSLIEMSIVLLIISIVASGALLVSSSAINNDKTALTKERMNAIYKALGNFMLKNYRLPCPAPINKARSNSGYGAEAGTPGNCSASGVYKSTLTNTILYGMVPITTLGLPEEFGEDGFGAKISYVVFQNYTKAEYPTASNASGFSYTSTSSSMPVIISLPSSSQTIYNAFVLISHGANKLGSFNANANAQNSTSGADSYEISNALSNIDEGVFTASFGVVAENSGIVTFTNDVASSETFDDIIFSKTRNAMIGDNDALFLLPCSSPPSGYVDSFYGKTQFHSSTCSAPNTSIVPSIKCIAFGVFANQQTCP